LVDKYLLVYPILATDCLLLLTLLVLLVVAL